MRQLSACTIVYHGSLVLCGYNLKKGGWEFSGGKNEGDEPVIITAIRELAEETGIEAPPNSVKFLDYFDQEPGWCCLIFTCALLQQKKPKVMEPETHREWRWFHIDALPELTEGTPAEQMVIVKYYERLRRLMLSHRD